VKVSGLNSTITFHVSIITRTVTTKRIVSLTLVVSCHSVKLTKSKSTDDKKLFASLSFATTKQHFETQIK